MQFTKATRKKSRLRLSLTGPSGSGKTTAALLIAKGLGGKIAMVDTEHGSGSLYADLVEFDTLELKPPYSPEHYIQAIKAAEESGYDVLIIDSMTHEWNGQGGALQLVDEIGRAKFRGNSYAAWGEVTPRHNAFVDAILQSPMHIICTMRSKADYVLEEGKNGKQVPKKVGMAPIQRDGLEYEFTCVLDLTVDGHYATASKDRTRMFADPIQITEDTGRKLLEWLEFGEDEAVKQAEKIASAKADWLAAIEEAEDLEQLKAAFECAYESARELNSSELREAFTAAKDDRKAILEANTEESEQEELL